MKSPCHQYNPSFGRTPTIPQQTSVGGSVPGTADGRGWVVLGVGGVGD